MLNVNDVNCKKINTFKDFKITKHYASEIGKVPKQKCDEFVHDKTVKTLGFLGAATLVAGVCCSAIRKGSQQILPANKFDVSYIKNLAQDMTKVLKKKIVPEDLSSIMGKEELSSVLPKFEKENFMAITKVMENNKIQDKLIENNIKNGIFQIDLHSHTNFSDGQADVSELLDNIVQYANSLYEKTGKKFIFSITDHDTIEGTKKAVEIIATNPAKFKNLRFVPGAELSFAYPTDKGTVEVSEMLVHGINPFSEETNNFINGLLKKRQDVCTQIINELNQKSSSVKYDLSEVNGDFLDIPKSFYKYKITWRIYNYAQIKQRLTALAQKWNKNPELMYKEIMPQWHIFQSAKCPDTFEQFMKLRNVDLSGTQKTSSMITDVFSKYLPSVKDNKVIAPAERTYDELLNYFSKDNNALIGFAHPVFLAKTFNNPEIGLADLIQKSNGIIKTTEKYHQAYYPSIIKGDLTESYIDKINEIIDKFSLLNTGGHDNHKLRFF